MINMWLQSFWNPQSCDTARMLSGRYITDKLDTGRPTLLACARFLNALVSILDLLNIILFCPALGTEKIAGEREILKNLLQKALISQRPKNIVQFLLDCSSFPAWHFSPWTKLTAMYGVHGAIVFTGVGWTNSVFSSTYRCFYYIYIYSKS